MLARGDKARERGMGETRPNGQGAGPSLFRLLCSLAVLAAVAVVVVTDYGDLRKLRSELPQASWSRPVHAAITTNLRAPAVFDIGQQLSDRMRACDYRFFVLCQTRDSECRAAAAGSNLKAEACADIHGQRQNTPTGGAFAKTVLAAPPIVGFFVASLELLARFPDAAFNMLSQRWADGPVAFWLGVFFVLFYVTLIVVSLRLPEPVRFFAFIGAVVFGLEITLWVFSLMIIPLADASDLVVTLAAAGVGALGVPACLLICIYHDVHHLITDTRRLSARALRLLRGRTHATN
jgi:hypothetical protein